MIETAPTPTERVDVSAGGRTIPLIPYDVFVAACVFLGAGRAQAEVLSLIGLDPTEWAALEKAYQWFHSHLGEFDRQRYVEPLTEADVAEIVLRPRWKMPEGVRPETLRVTEAIRDATLRNPHIGPFQGVDWTAVYVATHPEASLRHYFHDGETVFFWGQPLKTRDGALLPVDAKTFECVGGRWLKDKNHVYGQGELRGARARFYWYVVEGADAASFRALNLRYARDRNQAYYITGKTLRTKSPEAFEILPMLRLNHRDMVCEPMFEESRFARDLEKVYFYGAALKGARPACFRDLGNGYATDGDSVWFTEAKRKLEGADAASFTVPGPGEPHVAGRFGGGAVTDRLRPYDHGEPLDPAAHVEDWRAFFAFRTDLAGWWWHALSSPPRDGEAD